MDVQINQEAALRAYREAPEFVRAAFNAEATTRVIIELQKKHQLHVDQAGILAKEVGYLLLGLENPDVFVTHLKAGGFSRQIVDDIVKEINTQIFVPLREAMRKQGGEGEAVQNAPAHPGAQAPSYAQQAAAKAAQPQRVPIGFNNVPPPQTPRPSAPRPITPPETRSPITDPELELPSGEESLSRPVQPQSPSVPVPAAPSMGAPLPPKVAMPRPITPFSGPRGVMPAPATPARPQLPPQPFGGARPSLSPASLPGTLPARPVPPPPSTASGSDPYREPIE